jgi:hypothetical protein
VARHEAVCAHHGLLAPRAIIEIRDRYCVSRSDFARITRLGEATVARWERGALLQNAAYDQYLRLLLVPDNWRRLQEQNVVTSRSNDAPGAPVFRSRGILSSEQSYRAAARDFRLIRVA